MNGKAERATVKIGAGITGHDPESFVEVNGKRIAGVKRVSVVAGNDMLTQVKIEFVPEYVEIEGDAIVGAIIANCEYEESPFEKLKKIGKDKK